MKRSKPRVVRNAKVEACGLQLLNAFGFQALRYVGLQSGGSRSVDLYGSSLIEAPFFFWVRLYVSSVHGFSTTSEALDFGNFQGVGVTRFRGCPMGSQWVMGSLRCLLVFRVCRAEAKG